MLIDVYWYEERTLFTNAGLERLSCIIMQVAFVTRGRAPVVLRETVTPATFYCSVYQKGVRARDYKLNVSLLPWASKL